MDYRDRRLSNCNAAVGGSLQRLLLASMSLLIGTTLVLLSIRVVKSDELQFDHYLSRLVSVRRQRQGHGAQVQGFQGFPVHLLASAVLSLTWGTAQVILSLMFFFGELGWKSWCWANLGTFLANAVSLAQFIHCEENLTDVDVQKTPDLDNLATGKFDFLAISIPEFGIIPGTHSFHTVLIINTAFSLVSMLHSILMSNLQAREPTSENRYSYSYYSQRYDHDE